MEVIYRIEYTVVAKCVFILTFIHSCSVFTLDTDCSPCECILNSRKEVITMNCSHLNLHTADIPRSIPNTTQHLYLNNNILVSLKNTTFPDLPQLITLDLSYNDIDELDVGCFDSLKYLIYLNISNNALDLHNSPYKTGLFSRLTKLRYLHMHNNTNIHQLNLEYPDDVLGDLMSLELLSIDGIPLGVFGEGFQNLKNLQTLSLSGRKGNCDLQYISNITFLSLRGSKLDTMDLSTCGIQRVSPGALSILPQLMNLDLSENDRLDFTGMKNATYKIWLTNIRYLNLNAIKRHEGWIALYGDTFENIKNTSLQHLHLGHNHIMLIDKTVVKALPESLLSLHLDNNYLSDAKFLTEIYVLENLQLFNMSAQLYYTQTYSRESNHSWNSLLNTPHVITDDNAQMSEISQSGDVSSTRYSSGRRLKSKKSKKIWKTGEDSYIVKRTRQFKDYVNPSKLKETKITENFNLPWRSVDPKKRFTTMSTNDIVHSTVNATDHTCTEALTFRLPPNIQYIYAYSMKLNMPVVISRGCLTKNKLIKVDVSDNGIKEWLMSVMTGADSISFLNLSYNGLIRVSSKTFLTFTNLTHLFLQNNQLGKTLMLDEECRTFSGQGVLQYLDLSSNMIRFRPECMLQHQQNLRELKLESNAMSTFTLRLNSLMALRYLDLSNNPIQTLSDTTIRELESIVERHKLTVNMANTSLRCTCEDRSFLRWLSRTETRFENFDTYTCSSADGTLRKLADIASVLEHLDNQCISTQVILISIGLFVGFTLVLALPIVLCYKWTRLQYLYHVGRRHINPYVPIANEGNANFKYDAFISHSPTANAVVGQFDNYLKDKRSKLKLHIPELEGSGGHNMFSSPIEALNQSCCAIVFLDLEYMHTENIFEFIAAVDEGIRRKHTNLVTVILETIDFRVVPEEITMYCTGNPYCYTLLNHNDIEARKNLFKNLEDDISRYREFFKPRNV